jgi:hypothetical protein
MPVVFKEGPDAFAVTKIWVAFVVFSLGIFLLFVGKTYYTFDAFGIWILSCIAIIISRKKKLNT